MSSREGNLCSRPERCTLCFSRQAPCSSWGGGCSGPGCIVTQPACDAKPCPMGTVYVPGCNTCVTPVVPGGKCSLAEPCGVAGAPSGWCRDPGDSCQTSPSNSAVTTCQAEGQLGTSCVGNNTMNGTCAQGLYCASPDANDPQRFKQGNCSAPQGATGRCVLELQQDEPCYLSYLVEPPCAPCAPGLTCLGANFQNCFDTDPGSCTCRAPCNPANGAADCPCNAAYTCEASKNPPPDNVPPGFCTFCASAGQHCNFQEPCCAQGDLACQLDGKSVKPGENGTCCANAGGSCANGPCCSGTECVAGTCLALPGGSCTQSSDCATADGGTSSCLCGVNGVGGLCASAVTQPCTQNNSGCSSCLNPPGDGDEIVCEANAEGLNVCCLYAHCAPCETDADCCYDDDAHVGCQPIAAGSPAKVCCGIDGYGCVNDTACCYGEQCIAGKCSSKFGNGTQQSSCAAAGVAGCALSGWPCDASHEVNCCGALTCTGGKCE
jgi:hypothetical protein